MKPKIFIGCSSESLKIAKAIQSEIDHVAYTTVWTQDIFKLTSTALDDLLTTTRTNDFAIFIFNPDDITTIRNEEFKTVRDNVIFEMGLFLGKFRSKKRVFILKPRTVTDFHLPTDLAGITPGDYDNERDDGNWQAAVGRFCTKVMQQINEVVNTGILSLAGKWSERWWPDDCGTEAIQYFEDTDVTLEQFGNNLNGKFKFNGRTYIFEGKIEQMRYVTGIWKDTEIGATYSGSFQLLIHINGMTLHGRWVGFSASTNSIRTGIWEWKREGVEKYPSELGK